MLFTFDLIKSLPEFHHVVIYFHDSGEDYNVISSMESYGVDIAHCSKLTKDLVEEINPITIILNNTAGKQVEDSYPYWWLKRTPIIAIHHNPTYPLFPADLDIFVSDQVFERYKGLTSMMKEHKILPPCIDTSVYTRLSRRPDNNRCVIGKLSNDNPEKFPDSLIPILRNVNKRVECQFTIVGGSKYYKDVDLDNLSMPAIGSKLPQTFYNNFDILVYKNSDKVTESWGRVITEAMASGLPIVADSRGGITEQIEDGRTGFLCDTDKEFEDRLVELRNDSMLRFDIGMAARKWAVDTCDISRMRDGVIDVLHKSAMGVI